MPAWPEGVRPCPSAAAPHALSPFLLPQTKATWAIAAVNCLLGGLCLWKATRASKGVSRP